ncbi:CRISPR-associated protein [Kamptonema animale CS-326]|jgi:CRISPR-associated protein Cmr3|uniref:CRISPR-associated protein n=1 Tax=Kamptonema animale TaxID=92934 RepID=UPI00232FAAA1|nr:CRISPR-associated protein [Kamptonema animale]MDB9512834.1 CRISPR-associated protein [Kamptonema animale CS-326]
MFKYQILVKPLGMMYGSAGGFLSPENLVGRSGAKFPPEAATMVGLFFSTHHGNASVKTKLKEELFVAGPFWAEQSNQNDINDIYVPIPWSLVIGEKEWDEWRLESQNNRLIWERNNSDLEPSYSWQQLSMWNKPKRVFSAYNEDGRYSSKKNAWKYAPILHPHMKETERSVLQKGGLFLENAVQVDPEVCLVYLSTYPLEPGWYRFGGESHLVEINCIDLKGKMAELLQKPIQKAFALIVPGVWGSNQLSYRSPYHANHLDFPKPIQMLTDKPVPYRYSAGGQLGRGRYAVPAGSVYVLESPLNKCWWEWPKEWFPQKGFLKHVGGGLCLPISIPGLTD